MEPIVAADQAQFRFAGVGVAVKQVRGPSLLFEEGEGGKESALAQLHFIALAVVRRPITPLRLQRPVLQVAIRQPGGRIADIAAHIGHGVLFHASQDFHGAASFACVPLSVEAGGLCNRPPVARVTCGGWHCAGDCRYV